MSYGHADKIAAIVAGAQAAAADKPAPPIDPALHRRDDVRRILAERDIAALYRVLKDEGVTQRQIAALTGQSQSEVSEILKGRRVKQVDVLERICDGLGIERGRMRLGATDGGGSAYAREDEAAWKAVTDEMRRRALLAAASAAALSCRPFLGELLNLPAPAEAQLPSRLEMADVVEIERLTTHLRDLARERGGQADLVRAITDQSMRLCAVPASAPVAARLGSALAELNELAGWCCADSGHDGSAWHYFQRGVELAGKVRDVFQVSSTLRYAGAIEREQGRPNDALKLFQLGQHRLLDAPGDDPRTAVLTAWLKGESALALADMGYEKASSALARARDGWDPPDSFERSGMDELTARMYLDLGHLDIAESYAAGAVRAWAAGSNATECSPISLWPPSTSELGSPTGCGWRRKPSTGRPCSGRSVPASGGSNRSPTRWTPGPVATRGSLPGWRGRSPQCGHSRPDTPAHFRRTPSGVPSISCRSVVVPVVVLVLNRFGLRVHT